MRILVDLHTHTVASGHAYSTVKEMAQAAGFRELEAIAVQSAGVGTEQILNTSLYRVKNYLHKHKKIIQSISA